MNRSEPTQQAAKADRPELGEMLEAAFAQYQNELLGMLYYLLSNAEDARDAFQEAFFRCWRRRDGLGEVQNLKAWVFRVALNVGRDLRATAWRRRRRPLPDEDVLDDPRSSDVEANMSRQEQLGLVQRAVLGLRQEEQEVFLLRQSGDMTYDEIADAIHIPVGTVKTRMRLALEKLRQALEGTQ